MSVNEYFSKDYDEARYKFLNAASNMDAEVESIKSPERGPEGQELYTDVAWVGARDARKVLVLISGTHGSEGLCGSGVQVGALTRLRQSPGGDVAYLLVHAINPYGFAWQRRVTEEGIDLCRNFLNFGNTLPKNPLYDRLAHDIVPREWTGPVREEADQRIVDCIGEIGMQSYSDQIPLGQYKYDFAPFFGGQQPARANTAFRGIVRKYLSAASDVATIDFHTGLGDDGIGQLLCFHRPGTENLTRGQAWWGDALASVFDGKSVAYPLTGGILEALEDMLPGVNVTAAAFEFGTREPMQVMDALRADHWLHTYGDLAAPLARQIKQNMFDVFFGDSDEWRQQVWEQSNLAIKQAVSQLLAS